ncbi:hypothetical protein WJX64_09055 [Leifsonia sp. YIM 134122]|uniref:Septum formation-related domain-containing protein n=1 Tax=Leifsonia stereocauli TaxID=3134136 RepID=A0ABU9W3X2_9MICO
MPEGPDERDGTDSEHDPEIGGADWLLAQLSGGRRARRDAEAPAAVADEVDVADEAVEDPTPDAADDEPVIPVWSGSPAASAPSEATTPPERQSVESVPDPDYSDASDAPVAPAVAEDLATDVSAEPEAGAQNEPVAEEQREPGAVRTEAATSSAVWHLFSDFDDEPASPAPGASSEEPPSESEQAGPTTGVESPADDLTDDAEPEAGFHWGLRAGEDPAKYAIGPERQPDADADPLDDVVPPVVMAPFAAPVFGAPPAEPLRFPTPVSPTEPDPEPVLEPEEEEEAALEAERLPDPEAEPDVEPHADYADADTAATALLATSAAGQQSSFIDTLDASPALSGLSLPPASAAAVDGTDGTATPDAGGSDGGTPTPPTDTPSVDRRRLWIAGGLVLLVVLVGLFFLGTLLPKMFAGAPAPTPTASATPTPTPTPTPTVAPPVTGPAAAGEHPWDQLGGTECIDPYAGPWAETFTVVDCAAPHAAQLVYRGTFGGDATTAFPGEEAIASQINLLCSAPGVIDLAAAGAFPDLQLQGSFPVTEEQWTSGQRFYYCFVSRSGGEPITASVAGPGPAA